MSKNTAKNQPRPPTVITLTLPDEGTLPRTGTLLIQRGTLAAVRQFVYRDLSAITQAIQDAAAQFMDIEKNPPPDFKSSTPSTPVSTPAPADENAAEPADESTSESETTSEPTDTTPEPADTEAQQIPIDTSAADDSARPMTLSLL